MSPTSKTTTKSTTSVVVNEYGSRGRRRQPVLPTKKRRRVVAVMMDSDGDDIGDDDVSISSHSDESSVFHELWEDETTRPDSPQAMETNSQFPTDNNHHQTPDECTKSLSSSSQPVATQPPPPCSKQPRPETSTIPHEIVPKGVMTPESCQFSSDMGVPRSSPTAAGVEPVTTTTLAMHLEDAMSSPISHRPPKVSLSPTALNKGRNDGTEVTRSTESSHQDNAITDTSPKATASKARPAKKAKSDTIDALLSLEALVETFVTSKEEEENKSGKRKATSKKGKDPKSTVGSKPATATKPNKAGVKVESTTPSSHKVSTAPITPDATSLSTSIQSGTVSDSAGAPKKIRKITFQDQVLEHMLMTCKPWTLKTLAQSLHTTDTALHHVMLSLVDKRLVFKKEFSTAGKQRSSRELYWANPEGVSAKRLASPQDRQAAQEECQDWQTRHAQTLKELTNTLTQEIGNAELDQAIQDLQGTVQTLQQQVQEVHVRIQAQAPPTARLGGKTKNAAAAAREACPRRMKLRINAMRDEWKKRKQSCMDFVDQLADGMEKKVKDVVKLLNLETDEMEGVQLPPKYVVPPKQT